MRVVSSTTNQVSSGTAHFEITGILNGEKPGPISDRVAVTIAAWWQGPQEGNGLAFAELASTGSTDAARLYRDIANAVSEADNDLDRYALMALFAWATVNER